MSWTQEKMEELYQQMIQRATNDADFRRKLLDEPNKTLEELAGQPLPEGYKVNIIENDPAYTATCVLPDMISEELLPEELDQLHIDGGISFLLIISICGVAISLDIGLRCPSIYAEQMPGLRWDHCHVRQSTSILAAFKLENLAWVM